MKITREEARKYVKEIALFQSDKEVQYYSALGCLSCWETLEDKTEFNSNYPTAFREKPQPRYVPWTTHTLPAGIFNLDLVHNTLKGCSYQIESIRFFNLKEGLLFCVGGVYYSANDLLNTFKCNGQPCGTLET